MKALLGLFKRCRIGLITHVVLLLCPWASYHFGSMERDGNVLAFTLIFTTMGLLVFDFISIFIAADITSRADVKGKPVPKSRDFFLGFAVSGGLLVILWMALALVAVAIRYV